MDIVKALAVVGGCGAIGIYVASVATNGQARRADPLQHPRSTLHISQPEAIISPTLERTDDVHGDRSSIGARPETVEASPEPDSAPHPAESGSLTLRDQWFDVALANEPPLDPELWQRSEWREAFARNRDLVRLNVVIDGHHVAHVKAWEDGDEPPSLRGRIERGAPGVIQWDDWDMWDAVDAVDIGYSEHRKHGSDLDSYESLDLIRLRAYVASLDPCRELLAEMGR